MPWRTCAFHCSSFLLATAREVVSEGRFKALPPTQSFMVQVRQALSLPVFLSRYFSRKREPEPRSLIGGLPAGWPRSYGERPAPDAWGPGTRYLRRAGGTSTTVGASCNSFRGLP